MKPVLTLKPVLTRMVVLAMVLALLAGCQPAAPTTEENTDAPKTTQTATPQKSAEPDTTEILPVRYIVPDQAPEELDKVLDLVNEKMQSEGLNLELQVIFISRDVLTEKINAMLSAQEPFELMHIMENRTSSSVYIGMGALTPLDDLIDQYGPVLKEKIPDIKWAGARFKGVTYTVPAYWKDGTQSGGEVGNVGIAPEYLEYVGGVYPKTVEEFMDTMQTIKEKTGYKDLYWWPSSKETAPVFFLRGQKGYPFFVEYSTELFMVDQAGNVSSYYESEAFRNACNWYYELRKRDLLHPDYLGMSPEAESLAQEQGRQFEKSPTNTNYNGYTFLYPDVPVNDTIAVLNANAVPATTPHPEAGIMFLNWLYSNAENHNLLMYGIEGEHYTVMGDRRIEQKMTEDDNPLYEFPFWQIGYLGYRMFPQDWEDYDIQAATTPAANLVHSNTLGFRFDTTPVAAEYQNVMALRPEAIYPIKFGFVPYDEGYEAAIKKLKDAGLDKVVQEYEKQFQAFLAEEKE